MNTSRKFLFENCFDAPRPAEASPKPAAPQPVAEPTFSKADLEAARAEGFAAGHEQGQKEAQAAGEQSGTQALAEIGGALQSLLARQEETLAAHERNALSAGVTIVRKLFPRLAQVQAMAEIEQVVEECLKRLRSEPRIVVRVADPQLDPLRERLDHLIHHAGFEGKIVLLADDALAIDAVRVEWADGGAERDSDQIWKAIDGVLERALGSAGPHAETKVPEAAADGSLGLSQPA